MNTKNLSSVLKQILLFSLLCFQNVAFGQNVAKLNGYYPSNFNIPGVLPIKNQFIGSGDVLLIWVKGKYEVHNLNILFKVDSLQSTIQEIEYARYYEQEAQTEIAIRIPVSIPLYRAFTASILVSKKPVGELTQMYAVPAFKLPQLQSNGVGIQIKNKADLEGGQFPVQYYWMSYGKGKEKVLKTGSLKSWAELPEIKEEVEGVEAFSLLLKDANNLVSRQFIQIAINKRESNLSSQKPLVNISLYPNPCTNILYLSGSEITNGQQLLIYSSQGKLVLQQDVMGLNLCPLEIGNLPSGAYYLQVLSSKSSAPIATLPFIKF